MLFQVFLILTALLTSPLWLEANSFSRRLCTSSCPQSNSNWPFQMDCILFRKFFWIKRLKGILLHFLLPTLNASCNGTALAGWWRLKWSQAEGAALTMEWVETETRKRKTDGYYYYCFNLPSGIFGELCSNVTLYPSQNLRLLDNQFAANGRGLPRLIRLLADLAKGQTESFRDFLTKHACSWDQQVSGFWV